MSFSQNNEEAVILKYFEEKCGTALSIGENNGTHLSNVFALINKGWSAALCEPSPQVFPVLAELHKANPNVLCYDVAIGDKNEKVILHDSGELLGIGDKALVSTVKKEETARWASLNMPFTEVEVEMVTFESFLSECPYKEFNFISIDAEGYDLIILKQINLNKIGCECICIEHNGDKNVLFQVRNYCNSYSLTKELTINAENIIIAR